MDSKQIMERAVQILDSKKASDIRVLDIHDITVLGDYFIIASGTSTTQVKSLADELEVRHLECAGLWGRDCPRVPQGDQGFLFPGACLAGRQGNQRGVYCGRGIARGADSYERRFYRNESRQVQPQRSREKVAENLG